MSEIRASKRKRQKIIHNTSNDGDDNDDDMGTGDLAITAFSGVEKENISSSSSSSSYDVTTSMDVVTASAEASNGQSSGVSNLLMRLEGKTEEEIREYNMNIEKPDGMSNDFRCTAEKDNNTCSGMLLLEKCELPNCPLKLHPHLNPNHPLGNVIGRCYKCKANYHICPNPNCFKALKAPDILEKDSKNKLDKFGSHLAIHLKTQPLIPLKSQDNANDDLSHSSSSSSSYSLSQIAPRNHIYAEWDSFLGKPGDIDLVSLLSQDPISVPTSIKSFILSNKEADYSKLLKMVLSLEAEFIAIESDIANENADKDKILGKFGNLIFTIHHFFPEVKASEIFGNFRYIYIVNEDNAGAIQILEEIKNLIGVAEVPRIIEIAEKLYQHLIGSNQTILPSKLPVRYVDNDVKETIYDLEVMERQLLIPLSGNLERLLLSKYIISTEDSSWDEKAGLRFYSFNNKQESEIEPSAEDEVEIKSKGQEKENDGNLERREIKSHSFPALISNTPMVSAVAALAASSSSAVDEMSSRSPKFAKIISNKQKESKGSELSATAYSHELKLQNNIQQQQQQQLPQQQSSPNSSRMEERSSSQDDMDETLSGEDDDASSSNQPWTLEEDQLLLLKQEEIGNKWAIISSFLPQRNQNQLKVRFKSILRAANREWTQNENELLINLHHATKGDWALIASEFPHRTKNAVRKHHLLLMKMKRENSIPQQPPLGAPNQIFFQKPQLHSKIRSVATALLSASAAHGQPAASPLHATQGTISSLLMNFSIDSTSDNTASFPPPMHQTKQQSHPYQQNFISQSAQQQQLYKKI